MRFRKDRGRSALLASCSAAALLIGGGAPAWAACTQVGAGGYNSGVNVSGLCVSIPNAGSILNGGTISPSGIEFTNGTMSGGIYSVGAISGGISLDSHSAIIAGTNTSAAIHLLDANFSGGISNAGTISAGYSAGILIFQLPTFSGGISNSGTISGQQYGIFIEGLTTFSGGISNSGSIAGGFAGVVVSQLTTFSGGISNSGTISSGGAAIYVGGYNNHPGVDAFSGGITNGSTGVISGSAGIFVDTVGSFSGGISNAGTISAGFTGIAVLGVSNFSGGITNSGGITANGAGIWLDGVATFTTGNISNSGTISTAGTRGAILIQQSTINGSILDSGTILASSGPGISIDSFSRINSTNTAIKITGPTFTGGISNAGAISGGVFGIVVGGVTATSGGYKVTSFSGGVSNSGTISAAITSVLVDGVSTFAGGISNSGTIKGVRDIDVYSVDNFFGGITNSGLLSTSGDTAITVSGVSTFAGNISNSGTITGALIGILVSANHVSHGGGFTANILNSGAISAETGISVYNSGTFSGTIFNSASGTITAGRIGVDVIALDSFAGGITNAGRISAGSVGIAIGYLSNNTIYPVSTFTGNISNSGVITAGASGVSVNSVGAFSGGVANTGTISAAFAGIAINVVTSFSGGVSNGGAITAGYSGIAIGSVTTFLGGVSNSGTISATGGSGIGIASISTFSGGISNSGLISASRAGIGINDSGATTFIGGVTNSGTISAGGAGVSVGGMSGFGGGAISNSGAISAAISGIDVTAISTFAGVIANSGVISAAYGGIFVSNVPTFSGGVTNSGAISAAYGVYIGGGVTFAAGGAIVNSGTIIGSASAIDVAGATSPVTIDQTGGLISGAIKLSANADVLNVSGGTIAGDVVGRGAADTINFALGAGGSFTYGASYGFSGVSQVNVNSGTVILDGSNSATTVQISAGTLEVGDASNPQATLTVVNPLDVYGTLAGHGSVDGAVDLEPGGTLSPGGSVGTLTINGALAFSSSNSYAVEITPTDASKTQVNGAATLAGAAVVVTPALGKYSARTYTILTDTAGGLGGTNTFNPTVSVATSGLIVDPTLSYDADDVYLSVAAYTNPLVLPPNAPLNAQNVANAINGVIFGGGVVPPGFQALAPLTGGALSGAVNQLAGQVQGSFAPVGFEAGDLFLNLMLNPHLDGRTGLNDLGAPRAYAADPLAASAALAALTPPRSLFTPQTEFWAAAYGAGGAISGSGSTGAAGTRSDVYGFATGLDYRVSPNTLVGLALGGGGAGWSLAQSMGSGASQMFQAGVYGTTQSGPSYLSGALAYSLHDVTTTRTSSLGGFTTLKGQFDASVASSRLEAGYHIPLGGGLTATPYAAGEAQTMLLPSFAERSVAAASPFALEYASRTFADLRSELGGRFDTDWSLAGKPLKLYSRLAWAHDFDNGGVEAATFLSLPGVSFAVDTVKPARDSALVSAGFDYGLAGGWSLGGKLDGEFSGATSIYSATGVIRKVW